jgi:uncharacterized protein
MCTTYKNYLILLLLLGASCIWSCDDGKRYRKPAEQQPVVPSSGIAAIIAFQDAMNLSFSDPDASPLPDRYRIHFEGLDFFPPDTTYQVWAKLIRTPEALPFSMPTTTDRLAIERKYGTLVFELKGTKMELEVYQSPELIVQEEYEDYLFLPFTDASNGSETYAGGRYIDLRIPASDSILIDFNTAYNPYCAYNPKYSCPIVPAVNRLDFPVRAGVKAFRIK